MHMVTSQPPKVIESILFLWIYKAIVKSGIGNINGFIKYYAQYNKENTPLTLNIAAFEELADSHMDLDCLINMLL